MLSLPCCTLRLQVALFLLLLAAPLSAATVRVSPQGDDAQDGSSWTSAKKTIQAAVDAAPEGAEIWVADGHYLESITIRKDISLYGGFAGIEETIGERNWLRRSTIIDGGGSEAAIDINCEQMNQWIPAVVIDGFVIQNSAHEQQSLVADTRTDLRVDHVQAPMIRNELITDCNAGIYARQSKGKILSNVISGNAGPAIKMSYAWSTIANNVITGNTASTGAALYCESSAGPIFTCNTVVGNTSETSGVIYAKSGATPVVANCIIANNGAGIESVDRPLTIRNNCVWSNDGGDFLNKAQPRAADGNISADPRLVNVEFGDLHIQPDSPCRNKALITYVNGGWVDMDGQPRKVDGMADIGADQSDGTLWPVEHGIIYVKPDGDDADDGTSWMTALRSMQAGLDRAASTRSELWVAEGEYRENVVAWPYAHIYGGFAGDETARDQRDPAAHPVILNAGGQATALVALTGYAPLVVDGLTITGGYINYKGQGEGARSYGGGTFQNIHFVDNGTAGLNVRGGRGTILGNRFEGSGLIIKGSGVVEGNILTAGSDGSEKAGIGVDPTAPIIVRGNLNTSGGGISVYGGPALLERNEVIGSRGTGISIGGKSLADVVESRNDRVTGCLIGVENVNATLIMSGATIAGNAAGCRLRGAATLTNCTIARNARYGVAIESTLVKVRNSINAFNGSYGYITQNGIACDVEYSNDYGNGNGLLPPVCDPTGSNGNISVNPRFAAPDFGNFHIQPDSGCRDAGSTALAPEGGDRDGDLWLADGRVDMGADESSGSAWPAGPPTILRVSTEGDDANDGSSWDQPLRSIQIAVHRVAETGGEVWVREGIYGERISSPEFVHLYGGFAGSEFHPTERPNGSRSIVDGGGCDGPVVTMARGCGSGTLDGFGVTGGTGTNGVGIEAGGSNIAGCRVWGNTSGIASVSGITVGNTDVEDNTGDGLSTGEAAVIRDSRICNNGKRGVVTGYGCIVDRNRISGNASTGLTVGEESRVSNNAILCNGTGGITYNPTGGVLCIRAIAHLYNNTIAGNTGSSVRCGTKSTLINNIIAFNEQGVDSVFGPPTMLRNCLYGNELYDYNGTGDPLGPGSTNLLQDPGLADLARGNVHLQPDSPCVDAGGTTVPQAGLLDLDGASRIIGAAMDIGADESDGRTWAAGPYGVVHVSPNGSDTSDGSSWEKALRSVQAGITRASAIGGDVWVAEGIHGESLILHPFASMYGGFAGTETARNQRDPAAHETVLDGLDKQSVIEVRAGLTSREVDGFTIQNGRGLPRGGGVLCVQSSVDVLGCDITSNTSCFECSGHGGSAVAYVDSTGLVQDCRVHGNAAYNGNGGAVYGTGSSVIIRGNDIFSNIGQGVETEGGCVVEDNVIRENDGLWGGGLRCMGGDRISRNRITSNKSNFGAGIYVTGNATITDNFILFNAAEAGGSAVNMRAECLFINNTVAGNVEGAILLYESPTGFANNIIAFNDYGIRNESGSTFELLHNCFFSNGGGDYAGPGDPLAAGGNLFGNPQLALLAEGDAHLQPGSPCIDAGDDALLVPDQLDIDGQSRVQGVHVDIGADETAPLPVGQIKGLADGVEVVLSDVICSARLDDRCYVQAPDRSSGIGVLGVDVVENRLYTIRGTLVTVDGERLVEATEAISQGAADAVRPLVLKTASLGGSASGLQEGASVWLRTADGFQQRGAMGPCNTGLLVRLAGHVTAQWSGGFYLDDGAGIFSGPDEPSGVRVLWNTSDGVPEPGSWVDLTGASSCWTDAEGNVVPLLRAVLIIPE